MIRIKFIKSPSCDPYFLAYFEGDETMIEMPVGLELIAQGVAIPLDTHGHAGTDPGDNQIRQTTEAKHPGKQKR
jgi:hypothetical protein